MEKLLKELENDFDWCAAGHWIKPLPEIKGLTIPEMTRPSGKTPERTGKVL